MSHVVDLLIEAASAFDAHAEKVFGDGAVFSLPLLLADGRVLSYKLEVRHTHKGVVARELEPEHLPAFCPQRHINGDGTFCLFWKESENVDIRDLGDAAKWWGILCNFLKLQARAAKKREWPNSNEWAHGNAARYQKFAIEAAAGLGPSFVSALEDKRITLRAQSSRHIAQGPTLQVLMREQHVYSVWLNSGKVVNRKQRCFCGASGAKQPAKLRSCSSHAEDAALLALSLRRWQEEEKSFWIGFKNRECCKTCDVCPLSVKNKV